MPTEADLIALIEQATEQMSKAADTIEQLRQQLELSQQLYQVTAYERDHWYSVAIGGNRG
jgi:hypothetical protein